MGDVWLKRLVCVAACGWGLCGGGLLAEDPSPPKAKGAVPADIFDQVKEAAGLSHVENVTRANADEPWRQLVEQPGTPLVVARRHLFYGQYAAAERLFDDLATTAKDSKTAAAARLGKLQAILEQAHAADFTRFDQELAKLPPEERQAAPAVVLEARAMEGRGKVAAAAALLKKYSDAQPTLNPTDAAGIELQNTLGRLLERQANYSLAALAYQQVKDLAQGTLPQDSGVRTQVAVGIDRWAVLTGHGRDFHRGAVQRLQDVAEADEAYWPAHLALARILLSNHNTKDGGEEINRVLALNPNCYDAYEVGLEFAIENYDFDQATEALTRMAELSDSPAVEALRGRLLLKQRVPERAIEYLKDAVARAPETAEARGWLAGAYSLRNQPALASEQLGAIRPPGLPAHPVALYEAAEVLRDARQFGQAEGLYRQAAGMAAWWGEPYASLADLYLETGQEDLATKAKEQAFRIDPYNQRSFNQLTLLDYLNKFDRLETPHFIIRFDGTRDKVLAQLAAPWLEKVYQEVCADFQYHPTQKTLIELFPSHEQFGVRTTGLPWIGTVGACTGNVIAMDVPRQGADLSGNFDWARVMRHEFTHTVTLAMTNNRIPHWLTEAAACSEEQAPRDWENCELLAGNYRSGTLFNIQDLNWGFIRPKKSTDRTLAYMESQWIFEYITEVYGHQGMLAFLAQFRDGATDEQAVKAITGGKSLETFNREFLTWAGKQVQSWGLPGDPLPDKATLEARVAADKEGKDSKSRFELAMVLFTSGKAAEAQKVIEDVVAKDPKANGAREVLSLILLQKPETKERAVKLLHEALENDPHRAGALRILGQLAMKEKKWDEAEGYFQKLQTARPLDDASYSNLAGIYLLKKDYPAAAGQLAVLQQHEQHDERIPRRLADLYRKSHQLPDAESMAFKAVRIDPYNPVNHELLGQVLMEEERPAEAAGYFRYATELQDNVPEYWADLADAHGQAGDKAAAAKAAKRAVELDGQSPARKWLGG